MKINGTNKKFIEEELEIENEVYSMRVNDEFSWVGKENSNKTKEKKKTKK